MQRGKPRHDMTLHVDDVGRRRAEQSRLVVFAGDDRIRAGYGRHGRKGHACGHARRPGGIGGKTLAAHYDLGANDAIARLQRRCKPARDADADNSIHTFRNCALKFLVQQQRIAPGGYGPYTRPRDDPGLAQKTGRRNNHHRP